MKTIDRGRMATQMNLRIFQISSLNVADIWNSPNLPSLGQTKHLYFSRYHSQTVIFHQKCVKRMPQVAS